MKKQIVALMCMLSLGLTACGGVSSATAGNTGSEMSTENKTSADRTESSVTEIKTGFASSSEQSEIFVKPVEGIPDDFYCGADISSVLSEEASGVVYYDAEGNSADLFKLLSDGGVNYIRVRVWNDPYDASGRGYGGGNCDAACAAEIGKRAAEYGLKLLVDFHYSDFWADPNKQMVPKAWADLELNDKASALYEYTVESLKTILDAGADVGMVQIGNETTNGMSGEKRYDFMAVMMKEGSRAVREISAEYGRDIKIALHLTNPERKSETLSRVEKFKKYEIDYDVLALSYYPFWHGTLDNLVDVLTTIRTQYGKEVMVAETSYCYTIEDGDGQGNSVSEKDLVKEYSASVQSQANALRDVCDAVVKAGGLGVFYWEPAWIPVGVYDPSAADAGTVLQNNKKLWEEKGSGWASSYASEYDPKDAGKYYGGSSWDNQAWFDFNGRALPSLYTYKYLKYGASAPVTVEFAEDVTIVITPGSELVLPDKVMAHYNDTSFDGEISVNWSADDIAKVNVNKLGEYKVTGTVEGDVNVTCLVKVENVNLLLNPSFEDGDRSMYSFEGNCGDYQQKESDSNTGEWAAHYWNAGDVSFKITQDYTVTEDGTYSFSVYTQGGDSGDAAKMNVFAQVGDLVYKTDYAVDGWINWKHPVVTGIKAKAGDTITVGVSVNAGAGAWGTVDDFYLFKAD